jgi:hypothetical protein
MSGFTIPRVGTDYGAGGEGELPGLTLAIVNQLSASWDDGGLWMTCRSWQIASGLPAKKSPG